MITATNPRRTFTAIAWWWGLSVLLFPCLPARAYLADSYDARVADLGTLELELQPMGYGFEQDESFHNQLIAPSLIAYIGFANDFDVLFISRLYNEIASAKPLVETRESAVFVRAMLRRGSYNDESGPSLQLVAGPVLPTASFLPQPSLAGDFGMSVGLVASWSLPLGTLHHNDFVSLTSDRVAELFVSLAYEGPRAWTLRPYIEGWYDVDSTAGSGLASGVVGAYWDLSDVAILEAGVRVGAYEDLSTEGEIRCALWLQVPVWQPR